MKKSLWMGVTAMTLGCALSASAAVAPATYGVWSFEELAEGTPIPSAEGPALTAPYDSWTADTNEDNEAYFTNVAPSGVSFPITPTNHARSLYFTGSVTNHFDVTAAGYDISRYYTDFLLKPVQLEEDSSLLGSVSADVRCAFFFNTNGNLVLIHGDNNENFVTSTFASVSCGTDDWVRVTLDQDYVTIPGGDVSGSRSVFSVYINGTAVTHDNGYTRSGISSFTSGGGPWFIMKNNESSGYIGMSALVAMGAGYLDDVVNRTDAPAFEPDLTEAETWLSAHFEIGPEGDYETYEAAMADDADTDGFSNLDEVIAGTDPTNSASFFKITGITIDANGDVVVTFEGSGEGATGNYVLMEADALDGTFSNVAQRTKAAGEQAITNTPNSSPKFYKVVIPYTGE